MTTESLQDLYDMEDMDLDFDAFDQVDMFGDVESTDQLAALDESTEILDPKLSRRAFLTGTAGVAVGVAFGTAITGNIGKALAQGRFNPAGWAIISPTNDITLMSPVAEMGQGCQTSIPLMFAEELDCDWKRVSVVQSPPIPKLFGNPKFGNRLHVVASRSVDGYHDKVRMAGAQARRVILDNAAQKWGVPVSELTTEPSVVVHKKSGRRMTYGDVAKFAKVPAELPKLTKADLKKPGQFRLIGKDVGRVDVPSKVNGSAMYGIDAQVDGMLYATIKRAPVEGNKPDKVDGSGAMKIKGVQKVIPLPYGVAVIGTDVWAVFQGADALKVTWTKGKPITSGGFNTDPAMGEYEKRARNMQDAGKPWRKKGDMAGAMKGAAKVMEVTYVSEHNHHATMEPVNATARVNGDGTADIWVGTQAISLSQFLASRILKTKPNKIRLHEHLLGGGFGRKAAIDYVIDAVILANITKKPVKVIWTREEDVRHGKYRPMVAQCLRAGLDKDGKIVAWHHRVVGESVLAHLAPPRFKAAKGMDPLVMQGSNNDYNLPNQLIEYVREIRGAPLGAWRAIGGGYTKFALESFLDEIGRDTKQDPLAMRLELLKGHPRAQKVVQTVADMAGYGKRKPPAGRGWGFAYSDEWGTHAAGLAEVSVNKQTGAWKIHKFWSAVDPGLVIQPENVKAQMESAIIYGISHVLKEKLSFVNGEVEQSNFNDYEVIRMSEVPDIEVTVISTENHPTGIGEVGLPLTGGAIGNAIADLTGARLRTLPMTPDRVKAAMKA